MSLQWTLVAVFLYCEIAVIVLMMLPFISPIIWQKIFKSTFARRIGAYSNFYFLAFIFILFLLFLDSFREMHKYAPQEFDRTNHNHLDAELQRSMRVFRAQRNCYISGFSLFLALVIYRLGSLLSKQATLMASSEASLKQAKSASEMAQKLLKEKEKYQSGDAEERDNEGNAIRAEAQEKINEVNEKLESVTQELVATKRDLESVKAQAAGTSREYDRLLSEHTKLQEASQAGGESKKDD